MIPIRLIIEGLYSYQERQTIDFTDLVDAGLFGIFGTVGSGKSSILEAITFALYGETERLNLREKRYYNMMNLKSNRSYIEFDFINYENRLFRATREFKRNSKNFEDVKTASVQFYESRDNSWIPIDQTHATDIIGLSYDNFKRTIIIPQGQFKEFIELGATDRTKMMKEIFHLQKYDLQDNAGKLITGTKSELDQLEGKLSGFEEVSEEAIAEMQEKISVEKENQQKTTEQFNSINEEFQHIKTLKEEADTLEKNLAIFETLEKDRPYIEQKKQEFDEYERVFKLFNTSITEKTLIEKEISLKSSECDRKQAEFDQTDKVIKELENKLNILKPEYDTLDQQKQQVRDLDTMLKLKELEEKIAEAQVRTSKGKDTVENHQKKAFDIDDQLKSKLQELEDVKKQRTHSEIMMDVSSWYQTYALLTDSLSRLHIDLTKNRNEINGLDAKLKETGIDLDNIDKFFEDKTRLLSTAIKQAKETEKQLVVENSLAQYAHTLHNGEPCPLCGALEHPHIASNKDVSDKLQKVETQLAKLNNQKDELVQLRAKIENTIQTRSFYQNQINELQIQAQELNEQIILHKRAFIWPEFDPENRLAFDERAKEAKAIEQFISNLENISKIKRQELENIQKDLEKFNKALQQIQLEEARNTVEFETTLSGLKILNYRDFQTTSKEQVSIRYTQLLQSTERLEQTYKETEKELHTQNVHFAGLKASLDMTRKTLNDYHNKLKNIDNRILYDIRQNGFQQLDDIITILHKKIDTQQLRQEFEQFAVTYKTLKNKIDEQRAKFNKTPFNQELFELKSATLEKARKDWEDINRIVTRLELEYSRLQQAFLSKKELLQRQALLQKRMENLRIIFNMLKGNGFVQYVSSIFLRQLCDSANARFHRMTRNQLSLTLNENNDFEIIDYLNEGRSRSVKTLSGGQSFQVSLSLALALAESVQSNAKADKNFFFIDEGFGTQDNESVNIVFETLLSLQRENRIVGIISHVEELKERIPMSITVTKDEEKGSNLQNL